MFRVGLAIAFFGSLRVARTGLPTLKEKCQGGHVERRLTLKHLESIDADVLLVSAADKLHNARAILGDIRNTGDEVFSRFTAGKDETLWYYGELARIFRSRLPGLLSDELARTVAAWKDVD